SSTVPLFLDCDPGIDDALALAYLCCQDDVDVVGIAASGGNVATEQVVENTRGWLELADRSDIPVLPTDRLSLACQGPTSTTDHAGPEYAYLTRDGPGALYARLPATRAPLGSVSAAQAWVEAAQAHP